MQNNCCLLLGLNHQVENTSFDNVKKGTGLLFLPTFDQIPKSCWLHNPDGHWLQKLPLKSGSIVLTSFTTIICSIKIFPILSEILKDNWIEINFRTSKSGGDKWNGKVIGWHYSEALLYKKKFVWNSFTNFGSFPFYHVFTKCTTYKIEMYKSYGQLQSCINRCPCIVLYTMCIPYFWVFCLLHPMYLFYLVTLS